MTTRETCYHCAKEGVLGYDVLQITGNIYTEVDLFGLTVGECSRTD